MSKDNAITPEQALENTRELLEAKQQRDREGAQWETQTAGSGQVDREGFEDPTAAVRVQDLNENERGHNAKYGEVGARDRQTQARNDRRRD